jgi:hypothetical protein
MHRGIRPPRTWRGSVGAAWCAGQSRGRVAGAGGGANGDDVVPSGRTGLVGGHEVEGGVPLPPLVGLSRAYGE